MRRKSPRTAAPKASTEKTKSPPRKSRRHTRRKKQSTSESSDDSQDDQSLKEIAKQVASETAAAKPPATEDENAEPVWKVTPTDTRTGEVQKLKICLTRPSPSTPERVSRRRRQKSGGEDRSTPNEESSTQEDEKNSEVEEKEEKRGKGKSKGKHKSKLEKTPQTNEQEAEMQSEISENVQVTAQSPPIDIPVDIAIRKETEMPQIADDNTSHDEAVKDSASNEDQPDTTNCTVNVDETPIVSHSDETATADSAQSPEEQTPHENKKDEDGPVQINEIVETPEKVIEETAATSTPPENTVEESSVCEDAKAPPEIEPNEAEKSPEKNQQVESPQERAIVEEPPVTEDKETTAAEEETAVTEEETTVTEEVVTKAAFTTHEEDSVEKSVVEEVCKPSEESPESMPSQTENTTNESFVEYMEVDVSESEQFRILNEEVAEEQKNVEPPSSEPVKQPKKRKWGRRDYGFQKYFADVFKIDMDAIKNICTELKLLEENEVKLESTPPEEKRKTTEQKHKKPERKVSLDESPKPELKTQTSVNSTANSEDFNVETNANIIAMNRKISIVDDTASKLKPPPSPAKNPVSDILYITNLVRPFTLKQLKELLERTGKIKENGFWTDHIKSKCYVQYESSEEAEATRNALHGVQWPIGNGKKLIIEYSTEEEMEKAKNPPPPAPVATETKPQEQEIEVPVVKQPKEEETRQKSEDRREKRKKETHMREWDIGKEELEMKRSRSRERTERKRHSKRSASPLDDFITRKQKKQEESAPQKLMDDLFQKTKSTPCIYWLPLTPEEIAMKQQQRLLRMEEHKRRLEEAVRSRGDFNRGGPYRRRYD